MDITHELLKPLQQNRWINWLSDEYILPAYQNQSIMNIPASICSWFDIPAIHADPLREEIITPLEGNIKHIILILVDALSLRQLQRWILEKKTGVWGDLLQNGLLAPLTSVVPSTTSAAITTLWTGHSPAEHGVIGYELWLKEYGMVTNMINQSPMSFKSGQSSIQQAGFKPEDALKVPMLGAHLLQHGIRPYSFQHYSIAHSGLSRTFMKHVSLESYGSDSELWVNLRDLMDSTKDERTYAWVYNGTFDGICHRYGPEDERAELSFINFSKNFESNFLARLSPEQKKDTLLILTADHGQIHTPRHSNFLLTNHPEFLDALHILPTGEHRLTYLYIRPGMQTFIQEYVKENWPDQFYLFESQKLLESGLLGPGSPDRKTADRMGDVTLIARSNNYLWWSEEENTLLGRHGGLTPKEMLVPFLAARL